MSNNIENLNEKIKKKIIEERKEENKIMCKKYYKENKVRLMKYFCERLECDKCGAITSRNNLSNHKKTKLCAKRQRIKLELEEKN